MQKYEALRRWKGDTKLRKWGSSFQPLAKAERQTEPFSGVLGTMAHSEAQPGLRQGCPSSSPPTLEKHGRLGIHTWRSDLTCLILSDGTIKEPKHLNFLQQRLRPAETCLQGKYRTCRKPSQTEPGHILQLTFRVPKSGAGHT